MSPIDYYVCNAGGEEEAPSCFFQTVLQHSNQNAQLFLLLNFHVSTVHVNSKEMEVQKKKEEENEGLRKTRKE